MARAGSEMRLVPVTVHLRAMNSETARAYLDLSHVIALGPAYNEVGEQWRSVSLTNGETYVVRRAEIDRWMDIHEFDDADGIKRADHS